MSPSRLPAPVDKRTDLWSSGVVLPKCYRAQGVRRQTISHVLASVPARRIRHAASHASGDSEIDPPVPEKDRRKRLADAADARLKSRMPDASGGGAVVIGDRRETPSAWKQPCAGVAATFARARRGCRRGRAADAFAQRNAAGRELTHTPLSFTRGTRCGRRTARGSRSQGGSARMNPSRSTSAIWTPQRPTDGLDGISLPLG
jgi:hypothetical protein